MVPDAAPDRADLDDADIWILDRLDAVTGPTTADLADFQISKAVERLYHFVWDEFCDWYIEFAKVAIYGEPEQAQRTGEVLGYVLDRVLRLLHPFVPFVTERIWTTLTGGETLVTADLAGDPAHRTGYRGGAAHLARAAADHRGPSIPRRPGGQAERTDSGAVGRARRDRAGRRRGPGPFGGPGWTRRPRGSPRRPSLNVGLAGAGVVHIDVDTSGTVDVGAEIARLRKDLAVAEKELVDTGGKLGNPAFVEKAPEAVVGKIRDRNARAAADRARIAARLDVLVSRSG